MEQIRLYDLADYGHEIATFLERQSEDPLKRRVQQFIEDEKVAKLMQAVAADEQGIKATLRWHHRGDAVRPEGTSVVR